MASITTVPALPKRDVMVSQALRFENPAARKYGLRGPTGESTAQFMTGSTRTALITAGKNAAKIAFAGAVIAGCSVSLAGQAVADNCDPFLLSMTPQPVLACLPPEQAPPPEQAQPAVGAPVSAPVNDVADQPLPAEMPPPVDPMMPPPSDPLVPSP